MKVCIIQPAYSTDYSASEQYFRDQLRLMEQCDESMDLIVLPESCDAPCRAINRAAADAASARFTDRMIEAARALAKRCRAMVFFNARFRAEGGLRNTTYAINREGEIAGTYFKQHLTPGEVTEFRLDSDYSFEWSEPTVVEMEGLRFGFLTCYDFYFYEAFPNLARRKVDIIIGCSHQRSDTHLALRIFSQNLAYNTNAYVVRSSVSMDKSSTVGGASMVVAPTGEILADMESRVGLATVEIDPAQKYYKPAGFGNPPAAHYEYVEKGRRPWKYRPAGSAVVRHDAIMPYPRTCAHRGFGALAPENSLPSFGAAVALGAEEIEFDLWFTKDGEIVSIHDSTLDRVSDGTGNVWDYTLEELRRFDFGIKKGDAFEGMKIPTFEDILKKFSCHCIMNVHLKTAGDTPECLPRVIELIRRYDCEKYVYLMSTDDAVLERLQKESPDIPRCCGTDGGDWDIVERAIRYDCKKVQLFKPYFNREMIEKAHAHGIICNVFYADDPAEAEAFLDMGIDVILTNSCNRILQVVNKRKKYVTY